MKNLLRRENSQVSERRKEFKRKMGMSLNPLNESLVLNAMDMAISRRNVLIIENEGQGVCHHS